MISKYTLYTSDGTMTLSQICESLGVSMFNTLLVNGEGISDKLSDYQINGEIVEAGLEFRVPIQNTGAIEQNYDVYSVAERFSNLSSLKSSLYDVSGNRVSKTQVECFVSILLNGEVVESARLPMFPQEFSDSNSGNFSSQSLLGRSVDYQIYTGSSRDVSFILNLHREMYTNEDTLDDLVSLIESACYPGYSGNVGIVRVPEISFQIGDQFFIRGILTSCSVTWKPPIVSTNGRYTKYNNCDMSISVKETTGPYSNDNIRSIHGNRGGRQ